MNKVDHKEFHLFWSAGGYRKGRPLGKDELARLRPYILDLMSHLDKDRLKDYEYYSYSQGFDRKQIIKEIQADDQLNCVIGIIDNLKKQSAIMDEESRPLTADEVAECNRLEAESEETYNRLDDESKHKLQMIFDRSKVVKQCLVKVDIEASKKRFTIAKDPDGRPAFTFSPEELNDCCLMYEIEKICREKIQKKVVVPLPAQVLKLGMSYDEVMRFNCIEGQMIVEYYTLSESNNFDTAMQVIATLFPDVAKQQEHQSADKQLERKEVKTSC